METLFALFPLAALAHVFEEYVYPGGFPAFMRRQTPSFARYVTTPFAVFINSAFVLLCIVAGLVGTRAPMFSLPAAAVLVINGLTHLGGALRTRGYAPGVFTGVMLYLPLGTGAFALAASRGLTTVQLLAGLLGGLLLQAVPLVYLALARWLESRR